MFDLFDDDLRRIIRKWARPFKETDGYYAIKQKDGKGYIVVFNTLGVRKEDIKVNDKVYTLDNGNEYVHLSVSGKTDIPEISDSYAVKYELNVFAGNNKEEIEDVKYTVKDGLTYVFIKTKDAVKSLENKKETATKYIEKMDW